MSKYPRALVWLFLTVWFAVNPVFATDTVWLDDAVPVGATSLAGGGDAWNWVGSSPAPFSGAKAHQSAAVAGLHEHYFNSASTPLNVAVFDVLFTYVYLDPANPPREIMLHWFSGNWEHRAYWGDNLITYGGNNTAGRHFMGPLPVAGQWVRLDVPASAVALEGSPITGMVFSQYDGRATWDTSGSASATTTVTPPTKAIPPVTTGSTDTVWLDDAVPVGATSLAGGGDAWNWVGSSPAPFSGAKAHQSAAVAGLHEHYFNSASTPLNVAVFDVLFTYVYLDPANPPREIMLHWFSGNWEHRAYWGDNLITYGGNNTAGRHFMGPLPVAGQWVRLDVPASAVALEGSPITGMVFSQYDGRATWDTSGSASATTTVTPPLVVIPPVVTPSPVTTLPSVTVVATDAIASIGATDIGTLIFTRTGATTTALTVNYVLGGSAVKWIDYRRVQGDMPTAVTILPGTSYATMNLMAVANVTAANPETATFTLLTDSAYTVGTASTATISIGVTSPIIGPPVIIPPVTIPSVTSTPLNEMDYTGLIQPVVGDHELRVLSRSVLELRRLNTKGPEPARVDSWDFVDANHELHAPTNTRFAVSVDGRTVDIAAVGFKRRPFYAPLDERDLRIDSALYLQLATMLSEGQSIEVTNPDGTLWTAADRYAATTDPLRYSPAIHVNQEGYVPGFPKKAMVGYYLGSLGELDVPVASGFKIVTAATGATVFQGALTLRKDVGYVYAPLPYQKVLEADFSAFTTPGEYYLVVPGLGASLPFVLDEGIAMAWMRTYALGLYHQRCGTDNVLPFTRFVHDACHLAPAEVPSPQSGFAFTWATIADKNSDFANNARHTAPQLKDEASQLYPFVKKGTVDVSGGHHDAGDYSKYTINSAALTHLLVFTADTLTGTNALDNLGLPESGDGINDVLQEARHEAGYIAKLQDTDGGFYFIVYPKAYEYESNVTPDHGSAQVVWPKNTSATAASVAALAQTASSPQFKQRYPAEAAAYLQKARLGWQFLMAAIAKYGKDGSYQKITFYGDNFMHDDELAWAACELYLATGDTQYQAKLFEFFPDPSDSATFRWGWWRMSESWGNAIRSYAFAARSGRLQTNQLDPRYLAKCEAQILAAGDDALLWSNENAYASSFPDATKRVRGAGWYFSLDQASDMAVAYLINPKPAYLDALVGNLNYEAGTNPVNVTYLTGLGLKRQHEIVNQYASNDRRVLPPDGIPIGNIQASFDYLPLYGGELSALVFPSDGAASAPYPFYDRWADTHNVSTEFVSLNQARSLLALSVLVTKTSVKSTPWRSGSAQISVPANVVALGAPVTLSIKNSSLDLTGARIVWEARDQPPAFGSTYTISPVNNGAQWVELEIAWPDGRRVFATASFQADSPVVNWVSGALPAGAVTSADGGDAWTWVTGNPAPFSASRVHQSNLAAGPHSHWFDRATAPLEVAVGENLFAYVFLDPASPPSEIMLTWNDGSCEHRAYWGANAIAWGTDGSAGRFHAGPLPPTGQWIRLCVPALAVGLEARTVSAMGFSLFNGKASWDSAGKAN